MNHISLDLETLNTTFNSAITSIGACAFNPITGVIGDACHIIIDINDSIKYGTLGGNTIKWWMSQSDAARSVFNANDSYTLANGIEEFTEWVLNNTDDDNFQIWGNGATFDNVILEHAMSVVKCRCPWRYNNNRDLRTLKELAKQMNNGKTISIDRTVGIAHNAKDDAINQAKACIEYYRILGIGDI